MSEARLDSHPHVTFDRRRQDRIGLEEAVLAEPKTAEQIAAIVADAVGEGRRLLLTRLTQAQHLALPAALRAPVAAYVLVIALMAAQAIGRATVLRDGPSVLVAVGAGFFMLSDSLLATNRFVQPLPMAQVGVLATYYAAQALIVAGVLRQQQPQSAPVTPQTGPARSPLAA